jgi:hypothetical protein
MQSTDLKDLKKMPAKVTQTAAMLASNAAHLASLLKSHPYPGDEAGSGEHAKDT